MREERSGKRVLWAEKAWMQAGKRDGGKGKIFFRIKMQAVRKARKDAQSGKKAHFFYRISRKEGNKGNKKTEGKRRKKARMQKKQRREKSSGDTEMPPWSPDALRK